MRAVPMHTRDALVLASTRLSRRDHDCPDASQVLTAKIKDRIRVDYASYWSVACPLLNSPISVPLTSASALLLGSFCTLFYHSSGSSHLALGTLSSCRILDFPSTCYTCRHIPSYLYIFPSPAIEPYLCAHDYAAWRRGVFWIKDRASHVRRSWSTSSRLE